MSNARETVSKNILIVIQTGFKWQKFTNIHKKSEFFVYKCTFLDKFKQNTFNPDYKEE